MSAVTRRALSPAAHGVLLAVSAALRSRVAVITDTADGTTTATVTEPDGTMLLRCAVRTVSTRRDSRQLPLPLALALGPQHEVPAPVAVVTDRAALDEIKAAAQRAEAVAPQDDDGPAPINGVCVGDKIHLDDEPIEVMGVDHEGFTWRTIATDTRGRSVDEGDVYWRKVADQGGGRWVVTDVDTETPTAKAKRERAEARAAKPKAAPKAKPKAAPHAEAPAPQRDPAAAVPEPVRVWISEAEWDALTIVDRTCLEEPIGGTTIAWDGRVGWVTAEIADTEVLVALRGLAADIGVTLHEGGARPDREATQPAATGAELTLRVKRSVWQQHRSGLQDSAKGVLHKAWQPEGQDRVARVERGSEAHTKVAAYATRHGLDVRVGGGAE